MSDKATALLEQILEVQQEMLDVVKEDARLSAEFRKAAIRTQQYSSRIGLVLFSLAALAVLVAPYILQWFNIQVR